MKKKVIFAVATGLFAVATVFNMNMLQSNSAGDMSLESIAVMAQAQDGESAGGHTLTCSGIGWCTAKCGRCQAELSSTGKNPTLSGKCAF